MLPRRLVFCLFAGLLTASANAATPPALVNYQGVLRDATDKPRNGTFDMTFHFFDAVTAGNEILVDAHTGGGGVVVTGGLFNVQLGGGLVTDGTGPGTYTSLAQVFRDYAAVWMEVQVGAETLAPRIRVQAEPYALNASNLEGKSASSFLDTSATGKTKAGHLTLNNGVDASAGSGFGINASGGQAGGAFGAGGAFAYVADTGVINTGIRAQGNDAGGWFRDNNGSGQAYLASGEYGIDASGNWAGGHFSNPTGDSVALLAAFGVRGVEGFGSDAGGYFQDNLASPTATALAGSPGYGIKGYGNSAGGYFKSNNSLGEAFLGSGDYGINAIGEPAGYFTNRSSNSQTYLGSGHWGIQAFGNFCGVGCGGAGDFYDQTGGALAYVAYSNVGIETHASGSGGSFYNTNGTATALAIPGGIGLSSNGSKNFVQNHQEDPSAIIAYTSLEGDEAGTYTRGTARLVNGEARIPLGETFKWVTNPDIGLTVHLTPVGEWADLYIASKSTDQIVVRSRDSRAGNVAFDYIVFGLRIGFENNPVVRDKEHDMPIPANVSGESLFLKKPGFERFTALSRFRVMRKTVSGKEELPDLSASEALKSKIHVFDPVRDGDAFRAPVPTPPADAARGPGSRPGMAPENGGAPVVRPPDQAPSSPSAEGRSHPDGEMSVALLFTASEPVEAGDLLALDVAHAGMLARAVSPANTDVVGVVVSVVSSHDEEATKVALADGRFARVKADAAYGAIRPGDPLVVSATAGHVQRAAMGTPGTVLGKALEGLEAGTGLITVLLSPR